MRKIEEGHYWRSTETLTELVVEEVSNKAVFVRFLKSGVKRMFSRSGFQSFFVYLGGPEYKPA